MKRLTILIIVFCLATGLFAQQLKIATLESGIIYEPLVANVLKDAGFSALFTRYETLLELIGALAGRKVDGAYFLAQPIIAQIPGAIMVPIRLNQTDFYALSIDPSVIVNSPADLKKYTVGIVEGNMAHSVLTRGLNTVTVKSDKEQYAKLAAKSFQVAITIDVMVQIFCSEAGIKKYYLSERPLLQTPTFFALSAAQAGNKAKIEAAFKEWQDSGKWGIEVKKLEQTRQ